MAENWRPKEWWKFWSDAWCYRIWQTVYLEFFMKGSLVCRPISLWYSTGRISALQLLVCVCVCVCVCVYLWYIFVKLHKPSDSQSCLTFCDTMDCGPPGSSVQGILQARILEWVAISFSRGSSQPRDWTWISCIASRFFIIWDTREALHKLKAAC